MFSLSPAVSVTERDLTTIIPAVATTPGAIAGTFAWGPVLERVLIDSENNLVNRFGKPTSDTFKTFFTAANFLSYGAALYVVRNVGSDASNSSSTLPQTFSGTGSQTAFTLAYAPGADTLIKVTVGGSVVSDSLYSVSGTTLTFSSAPASGSNNIVVTEKQVIKNQSHFETLTLHASLYAKYPGVLGNTFKVILASSSTFASLSDGEKEIFSGTPSSGEIHFAVIDEDGTLTGSAGTVLERKEYLSTTVGALASNGETNYYKDWINRNSLYIWSTGTVTDVSSGKVSLINGASDDVATSAILEAGYDMFANADESDVSLLLGGAADGTTAIYLLDSIASVRKDCVAFISPEMTDVVGAPGSEMTNIIAFRDTLSSTSYGVLDSGWKLQYDRYNDTNRWVPLNGDIAGLCARTDMIAEPWYSPAGFNRGQIKNVIKLAYNPSKADRDVLYKNGINPVISTQGEGTVLFGDKTLLSRPSAFDRINVRRLFIVLEKSIATAAKYSLFEFNDEFTRGQFKNIVDPYLRDVQGRRGITGYQVVCDETNNTGQVIDSNEFVADILVKPSRSINFITLNFVAARTDVQFDEIGG